MVDERELLRKLQLGDQSAFEILVRLHHRSAYNLAFRYTGEHGAADDVVQDSFLKAYHAAGSFRGDSSFKSWLLRIVRNTALNYLRATKKREMVDLEDVSLGMKHVEYSNIENQQSGALLKYAIESLPPKQKLALELRIFEDLSFKEVAEIMECPFDTAKANFRHALMNLRKFLEEDRAGAGLEELREAFFSMMEEEAYEA